LLALGIAALMGGCAQTPPASRAATTPADPAAPVAAQAYRSVLGSYSSQRPAEPEPWREPPGASAPQQSP
jgi:hypothetical protein